MKIGTFKLVLLIWTGQAFKIAMKKECIPPIVDEKAPKCELHVEPASLKVQVSCHEDGVIRIFGDYNVLWINCTAPYPIDFHFDGIKPTEAIQVHSSRTLRINSPELEIESFHYNVKVLSISALYRHFRAFNSETKLRDDFKYSRTGNYQIQGFGENATYKTSFYMFLEEPLAKLDFIQNNKTTWSKESSRISLPCRPTHYLSNVTVNASKSEIEAYDVKKGFILKSEALRTFTCECSIDGKVVQLTFDTTRDKEDIPFGFIEPLRQQGVTITIHYEHRPPSKTSRNRFNIYSSCEVSQRPFELNMIAAPSFAHLKLTSDFVLPAFVNRSYAVEMGQKTNDLSQELRTLGTPWRWRVGAVFCANGPGYDAKLYGGGLNGQTYRFHFHGNMFDVSRENADISIYMRIAQKNPNQLIYDGDEVEFFCQVGTALLVPPVVWFVRLADGSTRRVHVDDTLEEEGETSSIKLKAATNMSRVICGASLWYKDFWRNVSIDIAVLESDKPRIVGGSNPEYKKVREDSPLVLTCRARGTPLPQILWKLQETDGTLTQLDSSSTSTNDEVTSTLALISPMEKTYICVVWHGFDEVSKLFHVEFSSVGIGIWAISLICLAVALAAALPPLIYFRYFRSQQPLGLNRYEIAEFVSGEKRASQGASTNEYAHEFAHLCPYDKSYEIDASRFQIDKTSFLGKGAFGLVLRGLVDGTPAAVKMISKNAEKAHLKALLSELKIYIHLGDHPHVVQFIGANTKDLSKGSVCIFVELCTLGNLENYLRTNKDACLSIGRKPSVPRHKIVMQDLINWTLQVASGMDHLSSKKVIHGDLAARNVLLDENRVAKITDFGLSRQFQAYAEYVKKQLEPLPWRWMALESLQHLKFSSKSDVWAFAVTVWEIFTLGEIPYVGMSWNLNFVNELEDGLRLAKPRRAPEELYRNVMLTCWDNRQELRPSFSEVIERVMHIFGMQDEIPEELPSLPPETEASYIITNIHCKS